MSENNMISGAQTIAVYEGILAITNKMLQAAQASDWEELVTLEQECRQLTNRLVGQHARHKLDESLQKKKIMLIQEILARDAEIRTITEPWMLHLQNLLTSAQYRQKLNQAYQ